MAKPTAAKPDRLTLPSGAWVELRDPMEVTHGAFVQATRDAPAEASRAEAAVVMLATAWSYETPPGDWDALDRLPRPDAAVLLQRVVPAVELLWPDFSPTPDRSTPTGPSSD